MSKVIIDAKNKSSFIDFKELYQYRDLFWTLAKRDFKVRYAQSYLGILWVIIQPIVNIVFAFFILGLSSHELNAGEKFIYSSSAVALWTYFQFVLEQSGGSIISSRNLIQKVYFPKLIVPLSKAILGFIDFGVALIILVILMIYYHVDVQANLVFAPLFILSTIISALGIGLLISALSVKYRDFKYMSPFLIRLGYMLTPIIYSFQDISNDWPAWLKYLYFLNPMAGSVEGFRWSITGIGEFQTLYFLSLASGGIVFIYGFYIFSKMNFKMADLV